MPGAGKTTYAIELIKTGISDSTNRKKYLYVTPYLDEVERIKAATGSSFAEPIPKNSKGSKLSNLKELLLAGANIITTHSLFSMLDIESLKLISANGYTLIMDEVANVLEQYNISKVDLDILIASGWISVNPNGYVSWVGEDYSMGDINPKYRDIKTLADRGNLIMHNGCALFWLMATDTFEVFDDVYILTYLFQGQIQRYFYDLCGISYSMHSVGLIDGKYTLLPHNIKRENRKAIMDLLGVYEDYGKSKLNTNYEIKENYYSLSSNWFRTADRAQLKVLSSNLYNFFKRLKLKSKEIYWSTLVDVAPKIKGERVSFKTSNDGKVDSSKCNFVPLNIRATNKYKDCKACAYVYNRFMNPMEAQFFEMKGIAVNQDLLALSDLIQFLFRGCIRDGEPLYAYIPSMRMRELLYSWSRYEL